MPDTITQTAPWFDARTSVAGATCTIAVSGELDLAVAARFEAAVDAALAHEPRPLIVDLSAVDFMDSSGIHVLLRAQQRAAARSLRLVVVAGRRPARRVLAACGVERALGVAAAAAEDASC
jgi:anti-sigma B factor antagonist